MIFAREKKPITMDKGVYEAKSKSHTRGSDVSLFVAAEFITNEDRVLVVDDFLASGTTAVALLDIVRQAGATCVGFAFLIEKSFEGTYAYACMRNFHDRSTTRTQPPVLSRFNEQADASCCCRPSPRRRRAASPSPAWRTWWRWKSRGTSSWGGRGPDGSEPMDGSASSIGRLVHSRLMKMKMGLDRGAAAVDCIGAYVVEHKIKRLP